MCTMKNPNLFIAHITLAFLMSACSVGQRSDGPVGGDDSGIPVSRDDAGRPSLGDGGSGWVADSSSETESKTLAGRSCSWASVPAATTTCAIPGTYQVTESGCTSSLAECRDRDIFNPPYQWTATVTVSGTEVKLTNSNDRLIRCNLTAACECEKGRSKFRFFRDGFVELGHETCQQDQTKERLALKIGVKQ
jgi:hypothetical protein